jgi:hypothetical protein
MPIDESDELDANTQSAAKCTSPTDESLEPD